MSNGVPNPIGYLLLRDGHAVPLSGLAPDDLKVARGSTAEREGIGLKHTSGLNAIVHCLGFDGDFGDYKAKHWDRVQRIMVERGLREYRNVFEVERNDLSFGLMSMRRRALADRIFFGPAPKPKRAFIGYGHDWESWDRHFHELPEGMRDRASIEKMLHDAFSGVRPKLAEFTPGDIDATRRWVYQNRNDLLGIHNFHGDQLLDLGKPGNIVVEMYFPESVAQAKRDDDQARARKVTEVFRWFIDRREDGWIEIIPVTDSLVLLKGPGGTYDILWRNLREAPPPTQATARNPFGLHPMDMPSGLLADQDFESWNYYRQGSWDEKERHEAEIHHYATGGRALPDYPGSMVVLERYLTAKGTYGRKPRAPVSKTTPSGFTALTLRNGRSLLVSEMVTVKEFRRFAEETGYFDRREGESWSAANDSNPDSAPVGATLRDALAYCAWTERQRGVAVRLFTVDEHRELRPFASEHYQGLSRGDFPWESWPPRFGLEASVNWSEPRFLEPGPDLPEFPPESGWGSKSRKRWIAQENYPPMGTWREPLPWVEYSGVRFLDAWDAYEWCGDGRITGRFWEGHIGTDSWGEYKNAKVGFRLVIEKEVGGK